MRIIVRDNNVEQALRFMKKKMQREGLFRELRMKEAFEKPSEKRVREEAEAVRRARKAQRKKLQREGLLPMPKLKPRPERKGGSPFPSTSRDGAAPAPATGTGRY